MKKNLFTACVLTLTCIVLAVKIQAITIPVEGTEGTSLGFVDMEKLFPEHPKYNDIKLEYDKFKEKVMGELKDTENEIQTVELEITSMTEKVSRMKQDLAGLMLNKIPDQPIPGVEISTDSLLQPVIEPIPDATPQPVETSTITPSFPEQNRKMLVNPMLRLAQTYSSSTVVNTSSPPSTMTMPISSVPSDMSVSTQMPSAEPVPIITTLQTQAVQMQTLMKLKTEKDNSLITAKIKTKQDEITKEQSLLDKKQLQLVKLSDEYDIKRKEKEIELAEFEKNKTLAIMSDFYRLIEDIAKEENISVVVEKSSILYGLPKVDLTEKARERLRGK
jgi:Skp family chaperone for outer membrane proteins